MRKFFVSLAIGGTFLAMILPAADTLAATTLFADTFNAGGFDDWTAVDTSPGWEIVSAGPNDKRSQARGPESVDRSLTKNVSTTGYESLVLVYKYKIPVADKLEAADHVVSEWSTDGETWNTLVDYTSTSTGGWLNATSTLPSGANDQAGFRFRFRATLNAATTDLFQLDDVSLAGEAIPPPPTEDTLVLCADAADNDGDGLTDWADPDCVPFNASPTVTLNGDNPDEATLGNPYVDPGATANDPEEGTLTTDVSGNVDTDTLGAYELVYRAVDAGGLTGYATRTVQVLAPSPPTGAIGGLKFNDLNADGVQAEGEPGIANWTIILKQGATTVATTTAADGGYNFRNLTDGDYEVCEEAPSVWVQTKPAAGVDCGGGVYGVAVTITDGSAVGDINFGNYLPGAVTGLKWLDQNGNGALDEDEGGLAGTTINLYDLAAGATTSAVTGDDGRFAFSGLRPGQYRVSEENRAGYFQTYPADPNYFEVTVASDMNASTTVINFGNDLIEESGGDNPARHRGGGGTSGYIRPPTTTTEAITPPAPAVPSAGETITINPSVAGGESGGSVISSAEETVTAGEEASTTIAETGNVSTTSEEINNALNQAAAAGLFGFSGRWWLWLSGLAIFFGLIIYYFTRRKSDH